MDTTISKLTKERWKTSFQGCMVDIDLYPDDLCVVEIEYIDELKEFPDYCGEEVTGKKGYSNIIIAFIETAKLKADTLTKNVEMLKKVINSSDNKNGKVD
jgi:CYTH domain-containing protein